MPSIRQVVAIGGLLVVLLFVAHWAAGIQAGLNIPFIPNPWKGTSPRNTDYFNTINAIAVTIALLIPAIGAFVLRRPGGPGPVWLLFWTAAYIAFVIHLYYGVFKVLGGISWVFHDTQTPPRVTNPIGDSITTIWWTADIILAWVITYRPRWVQIERGVLHAVIFVSALASSIVLSSNGYVRTLGVTLVLVSLLCAAYRAVVYPFDPHSASGRLYALTFQAINLVLPWYRLSTWGVVFNLGALRVVLREKNLHDTSTIPISNPDGCAALPPFHPRYLVERNMDGYYNDLNKPAMGSASDPALANEDSMFFTKTNPGARFGRNVPLAEAFPDEGPALLEPSPRVISNELLARRSFIPAPTLNFLAAAWIQFETHDWFNHGEPITDKVFDIPLGADDPRRRHGCPMHIRHTRPDPTRDYDKERAGNGGRLRYPPTYANAESHWWDASQIYGSNHESTRLLRTVYEKRDGVFHPTDQLVADGKLFLDDENLLIDPANLHVAMSGFVGNWWAGLSLLHTLFAREHNAICDTLKLCNPDWDGDRLFNAARMINSALMAKIHTVEWTPAILAHPALEISMNANWWGLQTERLYRAIGRISENEAFSGMPLSGVDHSGADYCLTEEFVSVYRMHPLMRDDLQIRSARDGRHITTMEMMRGIVGNQDQLAVFQGQSWDFADVFYSFGVANPGAITVHNFPNFLRELRRPDGEIVDLASIDVMRDRERGVPRYNRFRRFLHVKPIQSFDDLANPLHPGLPEELRRIYGQTDGKDNVERLDLIVGLFSEVPPDGFGFSDTAFRVFVLMASRRLKSDRFIANDFTPEVYTQAGIDWVNNNGMKTLLLRHFPELGPALYGVTNAFKPWNDVSKLPRD